MSSKGKMATVDVAKDDVCTYAESAGAERENVERLKFVFDFLSFDELGSDQWNDF